VTHEPGELWAQRGSVAVMQDGRILQVGEPDELLHRPASDYVRDFLRPYPFGPTACGEAGPADPTDRGAP
jgi:glycine betaine/proline transport system ATP-binding protein